MVWFLAVTGVAYAFAFRFVDADLAEHVLLLARVRTLLYCVLAAVVLTLCGLPNFPSQSHTL
jgi:hypothetical protein